MGSNKTIHLMFLLGGLLAFFLLIWTGEWIWGLFPRSQPNDLILNTGAAIIALTGGITLYRNQRIYEAADGVASELAKVTWPTKKETQAATIIVVVAVIISAILFGVIDAVWRVVTNLIYGG